MTSNECRIPEHILSDDLKGRRAAPELTKKLSRMTVGPCGLTMCKMSAVEDMRGMAPSFPRGRGKGRTWIRLHNTSLVRDGTGGP